jgi:hypothetical protein
MALRFMLIDILHLCEMMTNIVLQLMPTLSPTECINFLIIIHAFVEEIMAVTMETREFCL